MSTKSDISTQLKIILDARDERGFVDLVQIHKLVAPVDQRETIMLLSPKKIANVRARLTTNDFDPVRLDNGVFVYYELALDVIAFRRADLKNVVQKWKGELGGALGQIISAVPELALRVDEVFGGTGIRYTRIDGKFYFAATDMTKLILWDSERQMPSQIHLNEYVKRASENDGVLSSALKRTHPFRGGHASAIIDINDTARLWVNLPGARATAFRTQIISKWVRVFGGDLSLLDEIAQNNEIQRTLPENHPARAFGDEVGLFKKNSQYVPRYEPDNAKRKFDEQRPDDFKKHRTLPKQASGYVYCVAGEGVNIMKVGHWKSSLVYLEKRYKTYYGENLKLHARTVGDCRLSEKCILDEFKENSFGRELFHIGQWASIVKFIDGL